MTIKEQLLELLEDNRGSFISGEDIAKQLFCTRGAVWKAIKSLRDEGFSIRAVTNRGYCLDENGDFLNSSGIRRYIVGKPQIYALKTVSSTNDFVRELAQKGAEEGVLAAACEQSNGRGRRGRSFFSPADTGFYMSILLRPVFSAQEAVKITAIAAVAVCKAIEKVLDISTEIKWVNDIYFNGRKVAGILTEAAMNFENGALDYAVVGIGVNVYKPANGFPEEISDIAGALLNTPINDVKNKLVAEIYNQFMALYRTMYDNNYADEYRKRMMWQGERIFILSGTDGNIKTPAVLLGANENCELKVRYEDGSEGLISSGEISIRR